MVVQAFCRIGEISSALAPEQVAGPLADEDEALLLSRAHHVLVHHAGHRGGDPVELLLPLQQRLLGALLVGDVRERKHHRGDASGGVA